MAGKTKKAQVVIAAIDQESQSFQFLLLQTNSKRGSFWQNVTGKIEADETFEEGGLREAIEETNLNIEHIIDIVDLEMRYEFIDLRKRDVVEESFLFIFDNKWEVKIDPHEHQDYKWVNIDDINPESVKFESNYEPLIKSRKLLKHWGK